MTSDIRKVCECALRKAIGTVFSYIASDSDLPICLEIPKDPSHGDISTNIAMRLAREYKESPVKIAEKIAQQLRTDTGAALFSAVEVKPPGFINFFVNPSALYEIVRLILKQKMNFGKADIGKRAKVQIEFVSANPTGPLSVAHARQAAVGDSLAHILSFLGFKVTREYYLNDEGTQIDLLGKSIFARCQELLGEPAEFPENGYHGDYIYDIAKEIIEKREVKKAVSNGAAFFSQYGIAYILRIIKQDLADFKVTFDCWSSQASLRKAGKIAQVVSFLKEHNLAYEKDSATWFKSSSFGDDKDRVLVKSDGSLTYVTADIAYHREKFKRGFARVIDIWGPDHHGYIGRLKAAVKAMGHSDDALSVIIVQLATIYKDGKPLRMSTRAGQYISLRQVIDEIGADVARFFFLMRRVESHLDFDLSLAKKQSEENPVYYIQYAHARIASIQRKAPRKRLRMGSVEFARLGQREELRLIKLLAQFPDILRACLDMLDPYSLVDFLQELAAAFHGFYDKHRVITDDPALTKARLALVEAVRLVLAQGLSLLGVSVPEKM